MATTPIRAVNLTKQLLAITRVMTSAEGRIRHGELVCTLCFQPSPASRQYTVRLAYRHGIRPGVTVTDPALELHTGAHALPHVYPGDRLCLYYPGEWEHSMLLAYTVVPWISEWLLYYELWLFTGEWMGGGYTYASRRSRP